VPSCWVLAGGELGGGKESAQAVRVALCVLRFVLCILLIGIVVVVPVPFVCCSVKLPLSRPTSFCLFLSILLRTPAVKGAAEPPRGRFFADHSQTLTPSPARNGIPETPTA